MTEINDTKNSYNKATLNNLPLFLKEQAFFFVLFLHIIKAHKGWKIHLLCNSDRKRLGILFEAFFFLNIT